jgi:hypothetical protein
MVTWKFVQQWPNGKWTSGWFDFNKLTIFWYQNPVSFYTISNLHFRIIKFRFLSLVSDVVINVVPAINVVIPINVVIIICIPYRRSRLLYWIPLPPMESICPDCICWLGRSFTARQVDCVYFNLIEIYCRNGVLGIISAWV